VIPLQNYVYFGDRDDPRISIHDKTSLNRLSTLQMRGTGGVTDMALFASDVQPAADSALVSVCRLSVIIRVFRFPGYRRTVLS